MGMNEKIRELAIKAKLIASEYNDLIKLTEAKLKDKNA